MALKDWPIDRDVAHNLLAWHLSQPRWARLPHTWTVSLSSVSGATCEALRCCFAAHVFANNCVHVPFTCELPAEDGYGRFPPVRACWFAETPRDHLLVFEAAGGSPEGPPLRVQVRWGMGSLDVTRDVSGLYHVSDLRLVEVFT